MAEMGLLAVADIDEGLIRLESFALRNSGGSAVHPGFVPQHAAVHHRRLCVGVEAEFPMHDEARGKHRAEYDRDSAQDLSGIHSIYSLAVTGPARNSCSDLFST